MNPLRTILVTTEFHPSPRGRYIQDTEGSAEEFRSLLVKALKENNHVIVDLTGYNRYGRSFLDEAFAGLISQEGFTKVELDEKLTVIHHDVENFVNIIQDRIQAAEKDRLNNVR